MTLAVFEVAKVGAEMGGRDGGPMGGDLDTARDGGTESLAGPRLSKPIRLKSSGILMCSFLQYSITPRAQRSEPAMMAVGLFGALSSFSAALIPLLFEKLPSHRE